MANERQKGMELSKLCIQDYNIDIVPKKGLIPTETTVGGLLANNGTHTPTKYKITVYFRNK